MGKKATRYDYMFKIRFTKGRNVSSVTLTQTEDKREALAKFRAECRDLADGVKAELLDHDGSQIARNW